MTSSRRQPLRRFLLAALSLALASCLDRTDLRTRQTVTDTCLDNAECPDACIGGVCTSFATRNEACDDASDCVAGSVCPAGVCLPANVCGNRVVEAGEACDDGQDGDACDGCRDDCTVGCICATGQGCAANGEWCSAGSCATCNVDAHCGASCDDCTSQAATCRPDGSACEVVDCTGLADFTPCVVDTSPSDRAYDICVGGVCVSPGCGDASCNAPAPSFVLPDTNQRSCYDAGAALACAGTGGDAACSTTSYCGQDAQYGWDTQNSSTARFTRSEPVAGEPVVLDNVTGRLWAGCSLGQSGTNCLGGAITLSDWSVALTTCAALSWGGLTGWRLPDKFELQSIADYGVANPAIDATEFPATQPGAYWSSSSSFDDPTAAWYVDFASGAVGAVTKGASYVRCAR